MHALKHTYSYIHPHATFGAVTILSSQAGYICGWSQSTDWSYNSPLSKGQTYNLVEKIWMFYATCMHISIQYKNTCKRWYGISSPATHTHLHL